MTTIFTLVLLTIASVPCHSEGISLQQMIGSMVHSFLTQPQSQPPVRPTRRRPEREFFQPFEVSAPVSNSLSVPGIVGQSVQKQPSNPLSSIMSLFGQRSLDFAEPASPFGGGNSLFGNGGGSSPLSGGSSQAQPENDLIGGLIGGILGGALFGADGNNNRSGCLAKIGEEGDPLGIALSIVEGALGRVLHECPRRATRQQFGSWIDAIPTLISSEDITRSLFGLAEQTCLLEANKVFCEELEKLVVDPDCDICKLIILVFKPEAVKRCACGFIGSLADVQTSVRDCIGNQITGAVFKDRFGNSENPLPAQLFCQPRVSSLLQLK